MLLALLLSAGTPMITSGDEPLCLHRFNLVLGLGMMRSRLLIKAAKTRVYSVWFLEGNAGMGYWDYYRGP